MKKVWKCDHCTTTGNYREIKKHEEKCFYNPENETCGSCKFYLLTPYDYAGNCYCSKSLDLLDFKEDSFDYSDGDKKNCPLWEEEN